MPTKSRNTLKATKHFPFNLTNESKALLAFIFIFLEVFFLAMSHSLLEFVLKNVGLVIIIGLFIFLLTNFKQNW